MRERHDTFLSQQSGGRRRGRWSAWLLLVPALLLTLIATPVYASHASVQRATQATDTTLMNATIYLSAGTLQPMFQSKLDQQVPGTVSDTLSGIVNKLPVADRSWALQMANTLIQPSATLTRLAAQQGGLDTRLRLSLYPGDPKPIDADMLIQFSAQNTSTIQVSAQPVQGSPTLVSGPLTTLQVPLGQLNSIATTTTCGDAALALSMQLPIDLAQAQTSSQSQLASVGALGSVQQPLSFRERAAAADTSAYVEIPASALASLGSSIGTLPVATNLTAQNIQISVQGSQLLATSDIYLNSWKLGTATTTLQPMATNGSLAVAVISTKMTVLRIFTFPYDTYNKQIEQTLNTKLNGALAGKFNVSSAAIGTNSHVPCTASDSLVLTGTTGALG